MDQIQHCNLKTERKKEIEALLLLGCKIIAKSLGCLVEVVSTLKSSNS
jgi:hypothetical protein